LHGHFPKDAELFEKTEGLCPTLQELFENARDKISKSFFRREKGLDKLKKRFDEFGKKSRRIFRLS